MPCLRGSGRKSPIARRAARAATSRNGSATRRAVNTAIVTAAPREASTASATTATACRWVACIGAEGTSKRSDPSVPIASDSTSGSSTSGTPMSTRVALSCGDG